MEQSAHVPWESNPFNPLDPISETPVHDAPPDVAIAMPDAPPDAMPDAPPVPAPDLTLLATRMAASIYISREFFAGDSCALNECITGFGFHTLLRFETASMNAGTANLVMGAPNPNEPQWDYDTCHMHYHYLDFANYELADSAGNVVVVGQKRSFCLRDDVEVVPGAPATFDCNNQGLSVGWADVYANALDCQFIDITGVPPGEYQLRIELNPARTIVESNYDNNVALFSVTVP